MDYNEFGERIKSKYPEYKDMDNLELSKRIVAKYPEYKEQVSFEVNEPTESIQKGIDITPSGIARNTGEFLGDIVSTPIKAAIEKRNIPEVYRELRQNDVSQPNALKDFVTDTAVYSALPMLRGFKGANALTGLYQGGLIGGLEGLKEGKNPIQSALSSGVTGMGINALLPPAIKGLTSQKVKNILSGSIPWLKPETVRQSVKPNSVALDLNENTAQNLLMDTTERIQRDYQNLIDRAGKSVNEAALRLPEDRGVFASSLKNSLDDIYSSHSVSGKKELNPAFDVAGDIYDDLINKIDTATDVPEIGRVSAPELADIMGTIKNYPINWETSTAKDRQNILKQIYGDFARRLGNLSPELRKANREYSKLAKFDDNEGLKRIINPNVIEGNKIDSASSALKNYNSTITKGNTNRNIQDLEKLLVVNGKEPFLNTIDDINAAQDLLSTPTTGFNPFGLTNMVKRLTNPVLKGIRGINRFNQQYTPNWEGLSDNIRRLLTIGSSKNVPILYGGISND